MNWILRGESGISRDMTADAASSEAPQVRSSSGRLPALHHAFRLAMLGAFLIATNRWFTFIDDEARLLSRAAHPLRQTLSFLVRSSGQIQDPPLYTLLLHLWLLLTRGAFAWLRVPSTICYCAGLWVLARLARRAGGDSSGEAVIWLGLLWPYGFHYGRLAAWYSFTFLLVACVTLAYWELVETPSRKHWLRLLAAGAALVYTNYFGWAILACLAVDFCLRRPRPFAWGRRLAATAGALLMLYIPMWLPLYHAAAAALGQHRAIVSRALSAGLSVYVVFVSEAMAPWHWWLSVSAALAAAVCLVLMVLRAPAAARRLFYYWCILMAAIGALGILDGKRLLPAAAWLLLPLGITLGSEKSPRVRIALLAALLVAAGIGWYGTYARSDYLALRFLEPWQDVAEDAARDVRSGAEVIANNPSFFFYLTYALRAPEARERWRYTGSLEDGAQYPHVYSLDHWMAEGKPVQPITLLIRSAGPGAADPALPQAEEWLAKNCVPYRTRWLLRNPGYSLKEKFFFDESGQVAWRIGIREYACLGASGLLQKLAPNSQP